MGSQPPEEVHTARLWLRCWRAEDAPLFLRAVEQSLRHLRAWLPWADSEPSDPVEVAERLAGFAAAFRAGENWHYGIFDPGGRQVLGGSGLHPRRGPSVLEIGYWIHAHHVRQGYATEAAGALARAAFDVRGIERVEIRCDARNAPSAAVPRRLGFPLVEIIRDDPEAPSARPRDTLVFRLERGERERLSAPSARRSAHEGAKSAPRGADPR